MNTKNIFKYIALGALFLIPFITLIPLPFIPFLNSTFFPYIVGKAFAFRTLVEIAFASWVILAILEPSYRPRFSWVFGSLSIFIVLMFFADVFGENPLKSFWSNYERMEGWMLLVHLWAYFMALAGMFRMHKDWTRMFNISIIASILVTIYAFIQMMDPVKFNHGSARLEATFGNSTYLAVYLIFHIFLSLFFILKNNGKTYLQISYGVLAVAQFVIMFFTGTRGAFVAFCGGLLLTAILVAIFERSKEKTVLRRSAIITVVLLVVLTAGFYSIRNTNFVKSSQSLSRMASTFDPNSAFSRSRIWNMALQGFYERPVLGWGQENFNYVFNKHYLPEMYSQEQWFDRAHNVFFDWLIAGGILGLIGYLSLFYFGISAIWKGKNFEMTILEKSLWTGLFFAYFVHNFFVFDHLISYVMFILVLAYLHNKFNPTDIKFLTPEKGKNDEIKESFNYMLPVMSVILIFSFYHVVWKPFNANTALLNTLITNDGKEKITLFKKALSYKTAYAQEIREQLAVNTPQIFPALKGKELTDVTAFIKKEIEAQTKDAPNDARAHMFLSGYYSQIGDIANAEASMKKASDLSPNKQTFLFELSRIYLSEGKKEEAYNVAKKAYELDKSYKEARKVFVFTAIYIGRSDEVYDLAKEFLLDQNLDQKILQAFMATPENQLAFIKIAKRLISENPDNIQAEILLVNAYVLTKRKDLAIAELYSIKKKFPEIASKIDDYIKQVNSLK